MTITDRTVRGQRGVVLLSGGLDSTIALLWAQRQGYADLRTISYDYGQPHRDAELACAQRLCEARGVPFHRLAFSDAIPRKGLTARVEDHDASKGGLGINAAFVPGRNAIFLSIGASFAATWWPGNIDVIIGACAEDAAGFPDCRAGFLIAMGTVLRQALAREVRIVAPFVDRTKAQAFSQFTDAADRADIARSWSCYRGEATGPCGKCSACVSRAAAFAAAGLTDASAFPKMCGGDPHRRAG